MHTSVYQIEQASGFIEWGLGGYSKARGDLASTGSIGLSR